jgi:hypothetical protein
MIKFQSDQEAFIWAQFAAAWRVNKQMSGYTYGNTINNTQDTADAARYADMLLLKFRERNAYESRGKEKAEK